MATNMKTKVMDEGKGGKETKEKRKVFFKNLNRKTIEKVLHLGGMQSAEISERA